MSNPGPISKYSIVFFSLIFLTVISVTTCAHKNAEIKSENINKEQEIDKDKPIVHKTTDCDTALWAHVYNPGRLEVYNPCVTVNGVIEESSADGDGDQHMLLRLDKGFESYVNERNEKKKNGCIVIEAICVNEIKKKKVGSACEGYINNVLLPDIGAHVKVTGSFVNDTHNGWNEIHPISKIEVIN
jgi:hypothetical protein